MSKYQKKGYNTRSEYLRGFAQKHDLDVETVFDVADMLGVGEDFDGLLSAFNVW